MYIYHEFGKMGEDIAANYLTKNNYKIIDIIAREKDEIVFVEVKTRSSCTYGRPSEAVNESKQKHITKAAKYYIYLNKLENYYIRIDVIEVYFSNNKFYINHIKQII